jgi:FtsP/CotA-like multicopper oxidase with cupredoxin domain
MRRFLSLLALLAACSDAKAPADTAVADEPEAVVPLPDVWGPATAEDLDPADDVVEVHLTAGTARVNWVDDGQTDVWAYNGQVPGPLIHARVGDTVRVVLTNNLEQSTTIHWHGLRIDDAMDGVPAVQDPVEPGDTFTYEFVVPDAGSYWYHPHVRTHEQVEMGLQGALIVHEAEPVDIPERYFVVDDVWMDGEDIADFRMTHPEQMHGRHGNMLLANGQTELLEDTVAPAAPERWRIVNTANARTMWVAVTGASWRIIAIDGTLLPEPFVVERALLPVGQRLDLEVIPDDDATDVGLQIELPGQNGWDEYPIFAAQVEGEAGDGEWSDWNAAPLPEMQDATQEVRMKLGVDGSSSTIQWTINDEVYGDHDDIVVDANTPSIIEINETTGVEHPFHLHGQFFQVIDRNGEVYEEDGGLRDTVLVDGDDELRIYTGFENPGRWMAHCHILEHAELGMMTEMVVED